MGVAVIVGDDGFARCPWAAADPLLRAYHDAEWGLPVHDERGLYERICLEGLQAGLSWLTILRKRPALRDAFHGFDPDHVAAMADADLERLMDDARLVRNRSKLRAMRTNARATIGLRGHRELRELRAPVDDRDVGGEDGRRGAAGLDGLVWSFAPEATPAPRAAADVPTRTAASEALSRELKRHGFVFVGPTSMFALMEAIGMVDTHVLGCHRRSSSGRWPQEPAGSEASRPAGS